MNPSQIAIVGAAVETLSKTDRLPGLLKVRQPGRFNNFTKFRMCVMGGYFRTRWLKRFKRG